MKKIKFLAIILSFSSCLAAQTDWENSYLFTRIGSYSFNELNIGYGFSRAGTLNLELMLGIDYGSGYWKDKCGFWGIFGTEQFRTRTALRGINLRPTLYINKERAIGLTGIFRYAIATNFWVSENCNNSFDENRFYSNYKAFDYGAMFTIHVLNRRRISLLFSPGYKRRFYDRTRTITNSQFGQSLIPFQEKSNKGFVICDLALQIKFAEKKE